MPPSITTLPTIIRAVLGLWATFLITEQEPRITLNEDTVTLRTTLRFCALFGLVGFVLQEAAEVIRIPMLLISMMCG